VSKALATRSATLNGNQKIRLLLFRKGAFTIQAEPLSAERPDAALFVALSEKRADSRDPFLYHKSTHRPLYTAGSGIRPECIDVLFRNERDELTEGTCHNVVVRINGELVTPPLKCGLLPGVFRDELLERGEISEKVVTADQLKMAEEIHLINSVRRWRQVKLI